MERFAQLFDPGNILRAIGTIVLGAMIWQARSDDIKVIKDTLLELKSKMGVVETSQQDIDRRLSRIEGRLGN